MRGTKARAAAALLAALLLGGCAQIGGGATPEQAATATPEATAEPTPTPAPRTNPLTGLEDGDYSNKRPVAVMLRTLSGAEPQWGIESADVLVEGVTEGSTAGLMALYADADSMDKVGPVAAGRDLFLQVALPLNAVPVSIDKNIYAANLLNTLTYQDLDGYHIGKTAFAFDEERQTAGYREENCWYTTGELVRNGLTSYGASLEGENTPLFRFGERPEVAEESRNGTDLAITFSKSDTEKLHYNPDSGLYEKLNADSAPVMDADSGGQVAFTNVFVLYASSGIKDDGYTRQYDMTGGTGLYLQGGAWEQINWTKEDATGPFTLTTADGAPLTVAPGKSFIAIWGGYYGQALALTASDGAEQTLPEKPALLESGVSDEAAAAAEASLAVQQQVLDAQAALEQANAELPEAEVALDEAKAALEADSENADLIAARDTAQARVDELNQIITDSQAILDANAPAESTEGEAGSEETSEEETPAE